MEQAADEIGNPLVTPECATTAPACWGGVKHRSWQSLQVSAILDNVSPPAARTAASGTMGANQQGDSFQLSPMWSLCPVLRGCGVFSKGSGGHPVLFNVHFLVY